MDAAVADIDVNVYNVDFCGEIHYMTSNFASASYASGDLHDMNYYSVMKPNAVRAD